MHSIFSQLEKKWLNVFSCIKALGIKIKRTSPKQYLKNFCQQQGRRSIDMLMYVTHTFINHGLPWDRQTRKSIPNDPFFKTSSWYASRLMFSFKFCMFDISTFGSEELWEMEGDLCSAEQSSVRPWQQSLLEGSHRQQSKAKAGRERWVSVKILSLKPSHRKTGVKARNPYLFLMQPQQTERHFFLVKNNRGQSGNEVWRVRRNGW